MNDEGYDILSNKRIIRPHQMWSGKRCFRVVGDYIGVWKPKMIEEMDSVEMIDDEPEPQSTADENPWNITKSSRTGVFEATLPVPSVYYGYICGAKNMKRIELERETHTRITMPKYSEAKNIMIVSDSRSGVESACDRISLLLHELREKSSPSHFLSVPVNTPEVIAAFSSFKRQLLGLGVDFKLFQTPTRLHLTLATFTVLDPSEQVKLSTAVQEFVDQEVKKLTGGNSLKLRIRGVKIMCDDPTCVDILYGCVEEGAGGTLLQHIANKANKVLEKSGFLSWSVHSESQSGVKLHATLLSSQFKRSRLQHERERQGLRQDQNVECTFDATRILECFQDFDFGWVSAERLLVSVCGSEDKDGSHQFASEHPFASQPVEKTEELAQTTRHKIPPPPGFSQKFYFTTEPSWLTKYEEH